MNRSKNIESFLGCDSEYRGAEIVIFGAPFDGTTSYRPGTRFGPHAMRFESYGIESYSPYQDADLLDTKVYDGGDLELCFGDTVKALDDIYEYTSGVLEDGKLPVMLGGEHLVTLGAFRAVIKKYPDICVLHFDAHADLRDEYLSVGLSHACVIRRLWELCGDGRIYQFGIRSGDRSEFEWQREGHTKLNRLEITRYKLADALKEIAGKPVYLTVDLDILDPSVFPGTGTPEPGGVSFNELNDALRLCGEANVVAADVCELSPPYDPSGISTAAANKILRELLIKLSGRTNK